VKNTLFNDPGACAQIAAAAALRVSFANTHCQVVENGKTGLVVPAGDILLLAKAIKKLLADADMRRQMGEAGYLRLNKLFTSEKMTAQYYELLD
jgi:glycosyltransferase involved in cell wall biosynthesis